MLQTISDELAHVGAFINEQVEAGVERQSILDQQSRAFARRLERLQSITAMVGSMITGKINAGPWTPDQKTLLASAVLSFRWRTHVRHSRGVHFRGALHLSNT